MVSSNIIYKYSCGQCQSIYISETKRHLISKICEHKGISFRTNRPLSNPSNSNIRQHAFNCDHPILRSNFSLLSKCPSNDRKLLESIFIHKIIIVPSNNQNSSCPLNILNWIDWIFTMIFSCFYAYKYIHNGNYYTRGITKGSILIPFITYRYHKGWRKLLFSVIRIQSPTEGKSVQYSQNKWKNTSKCLIRHTLFSESL